MAPVECLQHSGCGLLGKRPQLRALRFWGPGIEKLRHGCKKLRWRERLGQHDAVGNAFGCPIVGVFSAHVNNGKVRIDFSGVSGDIPAVDLSRTQIDVRDKRSVSAFSVIKQLDGGFAGRSYYRLEPTLTQGLFDNALNIRVVFDDQDKNLIFHSGARCCAPEERRGYTRG